MNPSVALITGAGRGMGQLAALRLADRGTRVAVLDVDEKGLADVASRSEMIRAYPCDVTEQGAVAQVVKDIETNIGPVDRVMNAAGIARVGPLAEQDPQDILKLMAINYGGTVIVNAATLPQMLERGRGEVVNFASLAGWIPQVKMGAYCATKFALVGYSESLWMETRGRGVKVACVCPPAVATPMLPDFYAAPENQKKAMPIAAETVIDAIEKALAKDRFLVLPHPSAKVLWRLRRHTPGLLRRVISSKRFDLV